MPLTASQPFIFTGCVEVRQALDHRATDERELLERLEEVPAGSVFYHTHGYFLRHRPITTAYGNDFASWVATQVRDQVLAERLAVVNPFEFASLEHVREELASIIHDHLLRLPAVPRVEFGAPFYFQQSHMVEARARLGRRAGDFAEWIRTSLGMPELADGIELIDTYMTSLERVRARVLALVDGALEASPR